MKKVLTFVIMAFLMGGIVCNANAQNRKDKKSAKKEAVTSKKVVKEDWNKTLKEYEVAVDNCVSVFNKLQKDQGNKTLGNEFNRALQKAENLKSKLENAKAQLDRTQVDRLNKANQKLSQVYAKS